MASARQQSKVLQTKCGFRQWLIAVPMPRPSMRWRADHSTAPSGRSATDGVLAVGIGADQLGDVLIGAASVSICRPLAATVARSAFRAPTRYRPPRFAHWRAPHGLCVGLPWPTGVLVLPRLAASSIAVSIWPSRRSRSATVWAATSMRAARVASRVSSPAAAASR
jgi:hypothetical protein